MILYQFRESFRDPKKIVEELRAKNEKIKNGQKGPLRMPVRKGPTLTGVIP